MIACGETNIHVAVEFVVDLPADYRRMLPVMLCQRLDDGLRFFPVNR